MRICSGGQLVLDELVFDALVRERARGIEAERLEIARQHLHGGDAARLHRRDELGAGGERKIPAAPEAEPLRHRRGSAPSWRRSPRRRAMRASGSACCRRRPAWPCCEGAFSPRSPLSPAALAMACASSKTMTPSKSAPEPVDDLLHAARLALALLRAQRRVGGEQDAFGEGDRRALPEARQRHDRSGPGRAPSSRAGRPRSACRIWRSTPRGGGP